LGRGSVVWIQLLISLLAATHIRYDASNHRYTDGDLVPLYANKFGPTTVVVKWLLVQALVVLLVVMQKVVVLVRE